MNVFGSKYENKRIFFFENIVFLKLFLWVQTREIRPPYLNFLPKVQIKGMIQVRKTWKKLQFLKKILFFPELSSRLIESSFDKRCELFLLKVRNWRNRSSNLRKHFLRMFFWSRIMQFRECSRKLLPFSERFCRKVSKRRFFLKKNTVLKMFPRALPTALRPPYQIFFAKSPRIVWSKSEKHGKMFSKKNFFFQNDPQHS